MKNKIIRNLTKLLEVEKDYKSLTYILFNAHFDICTV